VAFATLVEAHCLASSCASRFFSSFFSSSVFTPVASAHASFHCFIPLFDLEKDSFVFAIPSLILCKNPFSHSVQLFFGSP
jgi:hypothetical protein